MTQPPYTSIPDTSDSAYWISSYSGGIRSTTFLPRDKELHQQLKQKAWNASQTKGKPPYKDRHKNKD